MQAIEIGLMEIHPTATGIAVLSSFDVSGVFRQIRTDKTSK
jgi:hypothetical protein